MKRNLLLFAMVVSAMLCACSENAVTVEESQLTTLEIEKAEVPTPLTFTQTRQVVADVLGQDIAAKIAPTKRYLKLIFNDQIKPIEVCGNTEIDFFPYPLFGEDADCSQSNVMYALVDRNAELPEGVEYEVLEEYFNPRSPLSGLTDIQAEKVVTEALKGQGIQTTSTRATPYDWHPWGIIRIYDEVIGDYVPLKNAYVTIIGQQLPMLEPLHDSCATDAEGYFKSDTTYFYGPVTCYITWGTRRWQITPDFTTLATTTPVQYFLRPWMFNIAPTDPTYKYACAYRAARNMESEGFGLTNGFGSQVLIGCLDESVPTGKDDYYTFMNPETSPLQTILRVYIYCKDKTGFDIYKTANREVGKVCQFLHIYGMKDYTKFRKIITESWGEFAKFYFPEKEYSRLGKLNMLHTYTTEYSSKPIPRPDALNRQLWSYTELLDPNDIYHLRTPLFIDIYDDFNQYLWPELRHSGYNYFPHDRVCFQDAEAIWDMAIKLTSVSEIKQATRSLSGASQADIDDLFELYEKLESEQIR